MPDSTTINTMQLVSTDNEPDNDSEDASATGTFGVRPMYQQIQASLRAVSLDLAWETINGLEDSSWTGGLAPTYISGASFSYQGDQTDFFVIGRRVRALVNSGHLLGVVNNAVFASNTTTVTVVWDSSSLDPSVVDVNIGSLNPDENSVPVLPPASLPSNVYTSITTVLSGTASGTDNYVVTLSPVPTGLIAGQFYVIKFTNANTGPAVLAVNAIPAVSITKNGSIALVANDIKANQELVLVFDGTNLQIVGLGQTAYTIGKPTDQTRTGTNTLADDSTLLFAIGANQAWKFSIMALCVSTGNSGLQVGIACPAGFTTLAWNQANGINSQVHITSGVAVTINGTGNATSSCIIEGIILNGPTAGNVSFQWSQLNNNADTATIKAGSQLVAIRTI